MSVACRTCSLYRTYGFPAGVVLIDPAPQGAVDFPHGRVAACPDCGVFPDDLSALNALRRNTTLPPLRHDPFALIGGGYAGDVTQQFTVALEFRVQLTARPHDPILDLDELRSRLFAAWTEALEAKGSDTMERADGDLSPAEVARSLAGNLRVLPTDDPRSGGPRLPRPRPILRCPGERDYPLQASWMREIPAYESGGNNWMGHLRAAVRGEPVKIDFWESGPIGAYYKVPARTQVGDIVKGAAVPAAIGRGDPERHRFSRHYVVTDLTVDAIRLAPANDLSHAQSIRDRVLKSHNPGGAGSGRRRVIE